MADCAVGVLIDLSLDEPSLPVPDIIEDITADKLNGTFTVDESEDGKTQPDLGSIDDKDLLKKHAEQEEDHLSSDVDILKEAAEDEVNQILEEKFDFDLSLSPGEKCKTGCSDDDEEVFFGPVGFSERCVAAIVRSQTPVKPAYKPVSQLNPQQQAELAKEALSIACRISNLRPSTSSESDTIDIVDSIQLSPLKSISDSFNLESIVIKNTDAVVGINKTFEVGDNKHDTTNVVIKPSPAKKRRSPAKACPPKQISKSLKILFDVKNKENLTAKRRSICKLNQPGSQGGKVIGTLTKQNLQQLSVSETNNKPQSRIKRLSGVQQPTRTKLQPPASKLPDFGANLSYIKAVSSESLESIGSKRKRQDSGASDTTDPGSVKSYKTETVSSIQTSAHRRSMQLPQAKGRRLSRLQQPGTVSSSVSMNNTFVSQANDTSMGILKPNSRLKAPSDSNKKNCIKAPPSVSALPNCESKLRKSNSDSNLQKPVMRAPSIKPQLIQPKGFQRKSLAGIESKIKPVASHLPKGPLKAVIPSSKGPMKALTQLPKKNYPNLNKTATISQPGMKGDGCWQLEETPVKPEKRVQPKRILDSTFSKANESCMSSSTPNKSSRAMRSNVVMATPTKSDSDISLGPGLPAGMSSSTPVDKSKGDRRSMLPMLSHSEFGSVGSIPSPFSVRGSTSSRKSLSSIGSESSVFENTNELHSSSRNVPRNVTNHQIQLESIDDMSPSSMLPKKTLVQYTPNIKEDKKPSNWSPVKRQRPASLEEQATQCTKRCNNQS